MNKWLALLLTVIMACMRSAASAESSSAFPVTGRRVVKAGGQVYAIVETARGYALARLSPEACDILWAPEGSVVDISPMGEKLLIVLQTGSGSIIDLLLHGMSETRELWLYDPVAGSAEQWMTIRREGMKSVRYEDYGVANGELLRLTKELRDAHSPAVKVERYAGAGWEVLADCPADPARGFIGGLFFDGFILLQDTLCLDLTTYETFSLPPFDGDRLVRRDGLLFSLTDTFLAATDLSTGEKRTLMTFPEDTFLYFCMDDARIVLMGYRQAAVYDRATMALEHLIDMQTGYGCLLDGDWLYSRYGVADLRTGTYTRYE